MPRPITRLVRSIDRQVGCRGAVLVVRLMPDGRLAARLKNRRQWYVVDLATLFSELLAAKGIATLEQLPMFETRPTARPVPTEGGIPS